MDQGKRRRAAGAMFVGAVCSIGSGMGTAWADEGESSAPLSLKQAHLGAEWADFYDAEDCIEAPDPKFPYAWHFVVSDYVANGESDLDILELSATFEGAGVEISPEAVQSGKGWYVFTSSAAKLLDVDGEATGDAPVEINLGSTCGPAPAASGTSEAGNESNGGSKKGEKGPSGNNGQGGENGNGQGGENGNGQGGENGNGQGGENGNGQGGENGNGQGDGNGNGQGGENGNQGTGGNQGAGGQGGGLIAAPTTGPVGRVVIPQPATNGGAAPAVTPAKVVEVVPPAAHASANAAAPAVVNRESEVLGRQVYRQLPKTGIDPLHLTMAGFLMILGGCALRRCSARVEPA